MRMPKFLFFFLSVLSYLPFFACKPTGDQGAVTDIISTSLKLSADPASKKEYDPNNKVKFTAIISLANDSPLVGGNVQFKYNNNEQNDWKNDCGDVPVSKSPDGTMQAACEIDLKGGSHTVTAVYTGFEKAFAPSNTDTITYIIDQVPTNIASFTTLPNTEQFTFGDTIQLIVRMNKDQPSMPDFFSKEHGGGVAFSIMQTSSSLLRFFQPTPQPIDICTGPDDIQAVNDPTGTTFTCAYKITPNFITDPHKTGDDSSYSVNFNAHYLGNDYYSPSTEVNIKNKTIAKIATAISNVTTGRTGGYIAGSVIQLNGLITGGENIFFSVDNIPNFTFANSKPTNPQKCTWTQLKPTPPQTVGGNANAPTFLKTFICEYSFRSEDVTNCANKGTQSCCIIIQYPGDNSHKASDTNSSQTCVTLTQGNTLDIQITSVTSEVTVGDQIKIEGTFTKSAPDDVDPDLSYLNLESSKGEIKQNKSLNCVWVTKSSNFSCTYDTVSGDPQYTQFALIYNDTSSNPHYTAQPQPLSTHINKISVTIDPPTIDKLTPQITDTITITATIGAKDAKIRPALESIQFKKVLDLMVLFPVQ